MEQLIDDTLIAEVTGEVHDLHVWAHLKYFRRKYLRFFLLKRFILRVLPQGFEQQASISLLYFKPQLPQGGVVCRPTALQAGDQLLVLCVVLKEVPDGKDGPLADNCRCEEVKNGSLFDAEFDMEYTTHNTRKKVSYFFVPYF